MAEPERGRRSPMRVAVVVLGVALVALAAVIAYLVWGNRSPSVVPAPTPQHSPTIATPSAPASAGKTATPGTTPPVSEPVLPPTTVVLPATATPATSPPVAQVSSAPPSSPATATTATTAVAAQTMMWDGLATFERLTVEVVQDDGGQNKEMIEGKAGLLVEVCATHDADTSSTTDAGPGTWTLQDSLGNTQTPQQGGYHPPLPTDAVPSAGKCLQGYLTFDYVSEESGYASLVYEDAAGNRAVWEFH